MADQTFSRTLFVTNEGKALQFYIRPCLDRFKVRTLIEERGGSVVDKSDQGCFRLVFPNDHLSQTTRNYLKVQFVYDCVTSNKLLPVEDYRIPARTDTEFDIEDIEDNVRVLHRKAVKPAVSKAYSSAEDHKILKFIIKQNGFYGVKGNKIWSQMEEQIFSNQRTWQSLKERYLKRIVPNLQKYDVSDKQYQLIKRGCHDWSRKDQAQFEKRRQKMRAKEEENVIVDDFSDDTEITVDLTHEDSNEMEESPDSEKAGSSGVNTRTKQKSIDIPTVSDSDSSDGNLPDMPNSDVCRAVSVPGVSAKSPQSKSGHVATSTPRLSRLSAQISKKTVVSNNLSTSQTTGVSKVVKENSAPTTSAWSSASFVENPIVLLQRHPNMPVPLAKNTDVSGEVLKNSTPAAKSISLVGNSAVPSRRHPDMPVVRNAEVSKELMINSTPSKSTASSTSPGGRSADVSRICVKTLVPDVENTAVSEEIVENSAHSLFPTPFVENSSTATRSSSRLKNSPSKSSRLIDSSPRLIRSSPRSPTVIGTSPRSPTLIPASQRSSKFLHTSPRSSKKIPETAPLKTRSQLKTKSAPSESHNPISSSDSTELKLSMSSIDSQPSSHQDTEEEIVIRRSKRGKLCVPSSDSEDSQSKQPANEPDSEVLVETDQLLSHVQRTQEGTVKPSVDSSVYQTCSYGSNDDDDDMDSMDEILLEKSGEFTRTVEATEEPTCVNPSNIPELDSEDTLTALELLDSLPFESSALPTQDSGQGATAKSHESRLSPKRRRTLSPGDQTASPTEVPRSESQNCPHCGASTPAAEDDDNPDIKEWFQSMNTIFKTLMEDHGGHQLIVVKEPSDLVIPAHRFDELFSYFKKIECAWEAKRFKLHVKSIVRKPPSLVSNKDTMTMGRFLRIHKQL